MKVDTVITLDNDVNCLLLEKANYNNDNYFLSVVLDDNEEPSDEYVVLKEIIENGYNLDLCGYPHEEEIILEPKELIAKYQKERAKLNAEIDKILEEVSKLLEEN